VEVHQLQAHPTAPHLIFFVLQEKVSSSNHGKEDEVGTEAKPVEAATDLPQAQAGRGSPLKVAKQARPRTSGAQAQQQQEGWVPTVDPAQFPRQPKGATEPQLTRGGSQDPSLWGARILGVLPPPTIPVLSRMNASLMETVLASESGWGDTPLHHRLSINLAWWKKWATVPIINLLREGIQPNWSNPPSLSVQGRQGPNLDQAQKIMEEYEAVGAVKRISPQDAKHLIPWFLLSKPEEGGGPSGDSSRIVEKSTNIFRWKNSN
jgi:hypothetical protein